MDATSAPHPRAAATRTRARAGPDRARAPRRSEAGERSVEEEHELEREVVGQERVKEAGRVEAPGERVGDEGDAEAARGVAHAGDEGPAPGRVGDDLAEWV